MAEEKKEKIKEVLDEPGKAIEKGVKKGWGIFKKFGKEVKDTVTNEKEEEKK